MADPSPTDATPDGQEPQAGEGQAPEDGATADAPDGQGGRTYDEAYVKQLRREASGYRTRLSELEERLSEYEDRDKTEQERTAARLADTEKRAADAELRLLRFEVAAERGLDLSAAAFLTGSTREEMELRAEELEKLIADKGRQPAAGFDGGARQPVPEKKSPEQEHNDLLLRSMGRRA